MKRYTINFYGSDIKLTHEVEAVSLIDAQQTAARMLGDCPVFMVEKISKVIVEEAK